MWERAHGAIELLNAQAITTTTQIAAVDLLGYADVGKREMKVMADFGTFTTTTTATIAITNSTATNGTFSTPAYGTSSAVVTAAGLQELNFRSDYRYIRAELTLNATGSIPISVVGTVLKREANS